MTVPLHDVCQKCGAFKREVNRWLAVHLDPDGSILIVPWETAVLSGKSEGYWAYFCGQAHALQYVSDSMSPPQPAPDRESTLVLKPPLTRDGKPPEDVQHPIPAQNCPESDS